MHFVTREDSLSASSSPSFKTRDVRLLFSLPTKSTDTFLGTPIQAMEYEKNSSSAGRERELSIVKKLVEEEGQEDCLKI